VERIFSRINRRSAIVCNVQTRKRDIWFLQDRSFWRIDYLALFAWSLSAPLLGRLARVHPRKTIYLYSRVIDSSWEVVLSTPCYLHERPNRLEADWLFATPNVSNNFVKAPLCTQKTLFLVLLTNSHFSGIGKTQDVQGDWEGPACEVFAAERDRKSSSEEPPLGFPCQAFLKASKNFISVVRDERKRSATCEP